MIRRVVAAVTVCLVLGTSGGRSGVADAARLRCGMVLGEQAVLDRDLACDGPALIVRNPRTVLQLNGHKLVSRRSCAEGAAPSGIVVEPTADGAQIVGPGEVRGFVNGIQVAGASRVRIRDLRVADSCVHGVLVSGTWDTRLDGVTLHRNGTENDGGTAVRVEESDRFGLETSEVFLSGRGHTAGAVDLRKCDHCRIAGNRIVANRAAGIRLDLDTHDVQVERNLVLDNGFADVVDEGVDNTFVLNEFERGNGVVPPALWPLRGQSNRGVPAVAGCATVADYLKPHQTVTVTCPQDAQLRGLRNSVVGYRLLLGEKPYGRSCAAVELKPAHSGGGGSVTCTNPDSLWGLVLEVTCCLN
jgi:hypothetical protein